MGVEKNSEPIFWEGGYEISEPCCKVRRSFHYPHLGGGGVGGGEIPGPLFVGWRDIPESIYWRELKIPWPMCRKEETPGLMWKEGG